MAELTRQELLKLVETTQAADGNERVRRIVGRVVADLFKAIDDLDITPDEFWNGDDGCAWTAKVRIGFAVFCRRVMRYRPTARPPNSLRRWGVMEIGLRTFISWSPPRAPRL